MTSKRIGLCVSCVHARRVVSGRGSLFWLCRRSETDPTYPRYPALPVRSCPGYEPDPSIHLDDAGDRPVA